MKKETNILINVNDTDDGKQSLVNVFCLFNHFIYLFVCFFLIAKAKVPYFMLENAFDTSVARGVKRAYTSLDSFGLRTGMYLRRYPLLRTVLFIYVVRFETQNY